MTSMVSSHLIQVYNFFRVHPSLPEALEKKNPYPKPALTDLLPLARPLMPEGSRGAAKALGAHPALSTTRHIPGNDTLVLVYESDSRDWWFVCTTTNSINILAIMAQKKGIKSASEQHDSNRIQFARKSNTSDVCQDENS